LATGIPARLTPQEGRKFGLTVGAAFLVLAAITRWRGHVVPMYAMGSLGAVLLAAGIVLPGQLGPVYRAWMGLAHAISKVTTPIFMGVIYFVIISPVGALMRAAGRNPLRTAPGNTAWFTRPADGRRGALERQF